MNGHIRRLFCQTMKSLLSIFALTIVTLALNAQEQPIEQQVATLVFNQSTAEAFFEAEFAPGIESMKKQGYSDAKITGAKKIIVRSVGELFADKRFLDHYSNLYRKHFTKTELEEIRSFYATKTGQKMFAFILTGWKEQRLPEDITKTHFREMHKELQSYFVQNPPTTDQSTQNGANQRQTGEKSGTK
jgi:hypothetical protein